MKKRVSAGFCLLLCSLIFSLGGCGEKTKLPDKPIVFSHGVLDGCSIFKVDDKEYRPFCDVDKDYIGECIGYCDVPVKNAEPVRHYIYSMVGYSIDEWIVSVNPNNNQTGLIYREVSVNDVPDGLVQEYDFSNNVTGGDSSSAKIDDFPTKTTSVQGPYGEIEIKVPQSWICEICNVEDERIAPAIYGMLLRPEKETEGWIELAYDNNFGVCGTGLTTHKEFIAGDQAEIGIYNNDNTWEYICFEGKNQGIIALSQAEWAEREKDAIMQIFESMVFSPDKASGAVCVYNPDSTNDTIGVSMDLHDITPIGVTVRFKQFDGNVTAEELDFGEGYVLMQLRDDNEVWEEVPTIISDYGFNDLAHTIEKGGTSEYEINWEWLYGKLSPGMYEVRMTIDSVKDGRLTQYPISACFILR